MNIESTWRTAAACLHRMRRAVGRFLEPVSAQNESEAARERAPAPFCVSYGRVVFCLYYPEPGPARGGKRLEH